MVEWNVCAAVVIVIVVYAFPEMTARFMIVTLEFWTCKLVPQLLSDGANPKSRVNSFPQKQQ